MEAALAAAHPSLARALDEARRAWPGVRVPPERFAEHVARHGAAGSAHLGDLYLALGCALGDRDALRCFERAFSGEMSRAARRSEARGLDAGELSQRAHALLFVRAPGSSPRIADYTGRGPLRGWLRVVLARMVLDHHRVASGHEAAPADADVVCALEDLALTPELGCARVELRRALRGALEQAFAELCAEDRALLRHRYVERLGIDGVATAHGVHRATAARQLARAESSLRSAVQAALVDQLRVGSSELASLLRSVLGEVELSLSRLLV